jgi:adenylosuccinate lyase
MFCTVASGLVVYPAVIRSGLMAEIPFKASENIIMRLVSKGGKSQEAHEEIRILSHQVSDFVKKEGKTHDLIARIKKSSYFSPYMMRSTARRCPEQVECYCGEGGEVQAALTPYEKYTARIFIWS